MEAVLQLSRLSFKRGDRFIINEMTVSLEAGQFIGLIGPNGTGKSTLLRLMANLLKPHAGEIRFAGRHLAEMTDLEVARAITYMPQSTVFDYQFTVEQAVRMGRHPHRKRWQLSRQHDLEIAGEAMNQTGIGHLKERFIPTLSGGERQLVFLAKAIAQQSDVILLDEPTSDLDIYHQVQIGEIIQELVRQGKTVIAAIHDINLAARCCDQLLLMRKGRVAAFAAPEEAISAGNLQEVFQTNTFIYEDPFQQKIQVIPYSIKENKC